MAGGNESEHLIDDLLPAELLAGDDVSQDVGVFDLAFGMLCPFRLGLFFIKNSFAELPEIGTLLPHDSVCRGGNATGNEGGKDQVQAEEYHHVRIRVED